ncbi:MAG: hypothetical protein AAGD47_06435 [Pseudomonadota bacterium]
MFDLAQCGLCAPQQILPLEGQFNPARLSEKQRKTELLFQQPHLVTDRAFGEPKLVRRRRKTPVAGHNRKSPKFIKVPEPHSKRLKSLDLESKDFRFSPAFTALTFGKRPPRLKAGTSMLDAGVLDFARIQEHAPHNIGGSVRPAGAVQLAPKRADAR